MRTKVRCARGGRQSAAAAPPTAGANPAMKGARQEFSTET